MVEASDGAQKGSLRSARPMLVAGDDGFTTAGLRRAVVEAHDRLGDRVLQRLGTARDDMDADMSELRSEIGALRELVESAGGQAFQRELGATLDAVRNEIAALRLETVAMTDTLLGAIERVSSPRIKSGPLVTELESLRSEIASLRRRISLRGSADQPGALEDAAIASIAEAVAERLRPVSKGRPRR